MSAFPLAVLLVLGASLAGLTPAGARQEDPTKILRTYWDSEPHDMLEPQTTDGGHVDVTYLVYEGLTRLDEELNVVPAAAESWEFNDDGTVITFHLRENLTYSDGTPLTAERFRYAIERICDPHFGSWDAHDLFDVVGCQELYESLAGEDGTPVSDESGYQTAKANLGVSALDERTLEIRLRRPAPYFPAQAMLVGFMPVKEELVAGRGPEIWHDPANWIGNGPFRLVEIRSEGDDPGFSFVPNERYWAGRAKLDGVEYKIMPFDHVLDAYKRGELDIAFADVDLLSAFEADPVLSRELVTAGTPYAEMINFNLAREPFQDKRVREAFAYAFDREAYCRTIDITCLPTVSWIPQGIPGAIDTDAYAYNPEKARAALAASSYGGAENLPEIVWYYTDDDPWERQQAEWIADQFRQVLGVDLTLTLVSEDEENVMYEAPATWPQMGDTYWYADLSDPHGWMSFWTCGSIYFASDVSYCNAEYDALVAASDRELDLERRIALAEDAQRVLIADVPAIFYGTLYDTHLVKPYVIGFASAGINRGWPLQTSPLEMDIDIAAVETTSQ